MTGPRGNEVKIKEAQDLLDYVAEVEGSFQRDVEHGNAFNFPEGMALLRNETAFHSAALAMLLNPCTKHGLGNQFWQAFVSCIGNLLDGIGVEKEDVREVEDVRVELKAGDISSDCESGGRIDIVLRTNNALFVIENKIDATDQPKQLYRYFKWRIQASRRWGLSLDKCHILYLTPFGKDAEKSSICGNEYPNGVPYGRISYAREILGWLQECKNLSREKIKIHYFIEQYEEAVKIMLGKETEQEVVYKDRIRACMSEHCEASEAICELYSGVRASKLASIVDDVLTEFKVAFNSDDDRDRFYYMNNAIDKVAALLNCRIDCIGLHLGMYWMDKSMHVGLCFSGNRVNKDRLDSFLDGMKGIKRLPHEDRSPWWPRDIDIGRVDGAVMDNNALIQEVRSALRTAMSELINTMRDLREKTINSKEGSAK